MARNCSLEFFRRLLLPAVIALSGLTLMLALFASAAGAYPLSTQSEAAPNAANCLSCHGSGVGMPIPADHQGRAEASCLACHPAASQHAGQSSSEPPTSASQPSQSAGGPSKVDNAGQSEVDKCMACHQDSKLSMTLDNGDKLGLQVDATAFANSIHGAKLSCSDCHVNFNGFPHRQLRVGSQRTYELSYYDVCKRCHFANYTKTLDSVHYTVLSSGSQNAPVCTDCHGAHDVAHQSSSRANVSNSCGACHKQVYEDYSRSVHGAVLLGDNNEDVPVCTTCHGVHNIPSATSSQFHLLSTDLCATCHSDTEKMAKYGLSPDVVQTYLDDFHGKTVSFVRGEDSTIWTGKAVCTDCHGVHDIAGSKDPGSLQIKANLLKTCQKCHSNATENFPDAWLSHYQPTINRASIVYLVKVYYWILIPIMMGGLVLHILLDLWRLARNR